MCGADRIEQLKKRTTKTQDQSIFSATFVNFGTFDLLLNTMYKRKKNAIYLIDETDGRKSLLNSYLLISRICQCENKKCDKILFAITTRKTSIYYYKDITSKHMLKYRLWQFIYYFVSTNIKRMFYMKHKSARSRNDVSVRKTRTVANWRLNVVAHFLSVRDLSSNVLGS